MGRFFLPLGTGVAAGLYLAPKALPGCPWGFLIILAVLQLLLYLFFIRFLKTNTRVCLVLPALALGTCLAAVLFLIHAPAGAQRPFAAHSQSAPVTIGVVDQLGNAGSDGKTWFVLSGQQKIRVTHVPLPGPQWGERVEVRWLRQSSPQPWSGDGYFAPPRQRLATYRSLGWEPSCEFLGKLRAQARGVIFRQWDRLSGLSAAFAKALILGMTDDLSTEETNSFRHSGTSHILALSGLHLSLLAGVLTVLLYPLMGKKAAVVLISLVLIFYCFLAGPIPSLMRALVMYLASAFVFFIRRHLDFFEILGLSFTVIALLWPQMTGTLSLQLSFLSLFGIAVGCEILKPFLTPGFGKGLSLALSTSISAVLTTSPLVSCLFGEIHPIGILVSLPLEPLTLIFTYLGILFAGLGALVEIIFGPHSVIFPMLCWPLDVVCALTFGCTRWGSSFPALQGVSLICFLAASGLFVIHRFVYNYVMDQPKTKTAINYPVNLNYDSPAEIRQLLDSLGLNTLKRWGQNFLINHGARDKIIKALELQPGEEVWEVGPGLGAMTHQLIADGHPLTVFEIDPGYIDFLNQEFGARETAFKIVSGDVVKTWKKEASETGVIPKVMGNLPYNAASAILGSFIEGLFFPQVLVITVQKEMAQRMTAKVGSKNYSSFSILCQSAFDVVDKGDLKPGSFFPPPEVTSTVVQLKPHNRYPIADRRIFHTLVREIYNSRRKTLRNNMPGTAAALKMDPSLISAAFEAEGIDFGLRAETLTIHQFTAVANRLSVPV